ncbi:hypothetical protein [Granulicella sp. dw_53]|uniref:hypothetical protein n=1 Tax=Granulicella sp. dw_53 TaxID=2719792 RepID=UPI001BD5A5F4|nr:hypothetical protein [Granulicella sp. dw_53]
MGFLIAGCGKGSTPGAKAGPILIANPSGVSAQASALTIGSTLKLSMMPSGDTINAGVDWAVTCGGNPISGSITNGACGTLAPAHTADGATVSFTAPSVAPIGTTVTITATVTSNPSQSSNVSLTVLSTPIAISFLTPPSTSMEINTITSLTASVTNDPSNGGVIWTATCGSTACGSFNPVIAPFGSGTTYTSPSAVPPGATVTITATSLTDTTKSVSTKMTITGPPPPPPPPLPIAITVLPANVYTQRTGAGRSANLTALVSNDSAASGVDWTLSCSTSNCGSISNHTASGFAAAFINTSNVPIGGTITITAKSTADPTKSASATANVVTAAPIVVAMSTTSPLPATLKAGSQATLAATAAPNTGNAGINWTATCGVAGGCGTFNLSPAHTASSGQIIYSAPATVPTGSVVTITASSGATTPSNSAIATTTIVATPPPPPSLSFTQTPPTSLVSATQTPIGVAVANDIAPGGVIWTVQCGNTAPGGCGWFAPAQTTSGMTSVYTAPPVMASPVTAPATSVTLTATSIADPTVSISSDPIAINPDTTLKVSFVPSLPSQMQINTKVNLNAAVANDASHAGVDWQVCASGCGFFTIKPEIPAILETPTTPYMPTVPAITATTVSAWPNGLPIPYTAPLQVPSTGPVAVIASAHADTSKANSSTITISPAPTGPGLNGVVQAGSEPVVGAAVSLYAAGISGYGSLATLVASAPITDSKGGFTIAGNYTCPSPESQMYLVATGGKVGSNDANSNLALMTALGSCGNLNSSLVVLNEVTTVASAFATAPFASDDALTGNSSYLYLGTSSSNSVGLASAFSAVNNLVDISTGQVRFLVPAENAAVPYVEINTLADILNGCASTSGGVKGDGGGCSTLFTATDLLGTGTYAASITPADTLQAIFNIAQHPVTNYGYSLDAANLMIGLASSASPFQPILTTQPSDWSISLNYTSGGGLSAASAVDSLAVDAAGNLWITDVKSHSVIEWNPFGAALSPSTGFPAGGGPIAIDATGNVWISGEGGLNELTSLGAPLPWSPFGGVSGGGGDIAIDALDNLWITNSSGVNEFNNLGLQLSPVAGYTTDGISNVAAVGIDSFNNVWLGTGSDDQHSTGQLIELTNPGGQLIISGGPGSPKPQMAADNAGDIWYVSGSAVCEATPYLGTGSTLVPTCYPQGPNSTSSPPGIDVLNARGIALDGAGTVWVAGQGGGTQPAVLPGVLPIKAGFSPASTKPYVSPSLEAGPLSVAVDGSGNVWVLLKDNTVTEYVGAAVPVVTPIALAVKTKRLAAKP